MSPKVKKEKPPEEMPDAPTFADVELEEALSQFPEGTVAKLYRMQEDGTKAFVAQTAPVAMTEERIAKAGAGKYVVMFWGPLGDGNRKGYKGSRTVYIAEGAGAVSGPVSNADGSPVTPAVGPPGTSTMDALLQSQIIQFFEMMGKQRQVETALVERLVNQPSKAPDWPVLLAAFSPIVLELIKGMTNRRDPLDQAREIAKLSVEERAPNANPVEQFRAMLGMLQDMRRMAKDGGGEGEGEGETPAYLRVFERVGVPLLEKLLTTKASAAPAEAGAPGAPAPERAALAEPLVTDGVPMDVLTLIRPYLPMLRAFAEQDRDPGRVAGALLLEVPDGLHPMLARELKEDTFTMRLTTAAPELRPFLPWVENLREEILYSILGDDDADAASVEMTPPA